MEFKFCKHSEISPEDLKKIIELKNIHWHYTFEQHINWIENNLMADDIHVMMLDNSQLVAYMNLVEIFIDINTVAEPFLGIGNVCSRDKFSGFGRKLLIGVNDYLKLENCNGILLCKDELVGFYAKFDWVLVNRENIISEKYKDINLMTFNYNADIKSLRYYGRNF